MKVLALDRDGVINFDSDSYILNKKNWRPIPGSLEAPFMAAKLIKHGGFDGIVVLGCVIEGETYHNFIIQETAHYALVNLSVNNLIPIGVGILTVKNYDQALVRSSDEKPYAKHAIQAVFDLL